MAENKTKPTAASVEAWLAGITEKTRREDCAKLILLMQKETKKEPRMWSSMVGFGQYHYRYESGREGDFFVIGLASRKNDLTLYLPGCDGQHGTLLARLGKHRTGKSCLYLKRFADVDTAVLKELLAASVRDMRSRYACS